MPKFNLRIPTLMLIPNATHMRWLEHQSKTHTVGIKQDAQPHALAILPYKVEWQALAKQKECLAELVINGDFLTTETREALDGLLHFLDAFQDAASADGFPVVFLTDNEG